MTGKAEPEAGPENSPAAEPQEQGGAHPPAPPRRRQWKLLPLAAGLAALTRPVFQRQGKAAAPLMADWPAVVGPEIARLAIPVKLSPARSAQEGGVLTLLATGSAALELQHIAPTVIARINSFAGRSLVRDIKLVQTGPRLSAGAAQARLARIAQASAAGATAPAARAGGRGSAPLPPPLPPPLPLGPRELAERRARIDHALAAIENPELRAALSRLGQSLPSGIRRRRP